MTVMGIALLILGMTCFVMVIKTSRVEYVQSCLWLIAPIMHLTGKYEEIKVDPVVMGICLIMFAINTTPLIHVKIWRLNIKRGNAAVRFLVFTGAFFLLSFCIYQSGLFAWFLQKHFIIIQNKEMVSYIIIGGKAFLAILLLIICIWRTGEALLRFFDRFIGKKRKFALLKCKTFSRRRLIQRCYLEGVNNGKKYMFRVTPSVYWNVKKSETLVLSAVLGCANGIYCFTAPVVRKRKIVRSRKKM